jgi:hypothetical protein
VTQLEKDGITCMAIHGNKSQTASTKALADFKAGKLTALIDFDYSLKAPKIRALLSIIGFIDNPQQFVEGTKDFDRFKGKNFYHLLPILQ